MSRSRSGEGARRPVAAPLLDVTRLLGEEHEPDGRGERCERGLRRLRDPKVRGLHRLRDHADEDRRQQPRSEVRPRRRSTEWRTNTIGPGSSPVPPLGCGYRRTTASATAETVAVETHCATTSRRTSPRGDRRADGHRGEAERHREQHGPPRRRSGSAATAPHSRRLPRLHEWEQRRNEQRVAHASDRPHPRSDERGDDDGGARRARRRRPSRSAPTAQQVEHRPVR